MWISYRWRNIFFFYQKQIIEQTKFVYSPLEKSFDKQTEKQAGASNSQDIFNKKDELKHIQGIFPQHLMNDLICVKTKEIIKLKDIKKDDLNYKSKLRKNITYCFLRDIHEGYLSLENADHKQSNFAIELKEFLKRYKNTWKNNLGLLFSAIEQILDTFESRIFPIKNLGKIPTHAPTPEVATEQTPKPAADATPT